MLLKVLIFLKRKISICIKFKFLLIGLIKFVKININYLFLEVLLRMRLFKEKICKLLFVILCFTFISCLAASAAEIWPRDIIHVGEDKFEVILVDKDSQKLYFLKKEEGKAFKIIHELNCSTGKKIGDKNKSGDAKTPEGVYYITGHHLDRYLAPVYGTRAFTLDYPNFIDKAEGKNGYNIWIHGTDKDPLEKRTTNGCVALANNDIDKLKNIIRVGKTPVIIKKKIDFTDFETSENETGIKIKEFFSDWQKSLTAGSYHTYLSFYADDFLPDISWWMDWRSKRKKLPEIVSMGNKNLKIFREDKGLYTIWFDEFMGSKENNVVLGHRKLFVKSIDNKFKIIADFYSDSKTDLLTAAVKLDKDLNFDANIKKFIADWSRAWSNKDIKMYSKSYSSKFYSDGMNKKQWISHKKRLNKKYRYISVEVENIKVQTDGEYMVAEFLQKYKSSGFSATGVKTLILKQEKDSWKIFKEMWKKSG